jgi:hypothetical protein
MGAVARTRSLDRCGQTQPPARLHERDYVLGPRSFVEVHCEEPAGLIFEKRVHAPHMSAGEVTDYRGGGEADERLIRVFAAPAALYFGQLAYGHGQTCFPTIILEKYLYYQLVSSISARAENPRIGVQLPPLSPISG